jgi:hypothetical protein
LHYGYTSIDLGAYGLTAVGLGATVFLWRKREDELEPLPDDDEWLLAPLPPTTYDPSFNASIDPLTSTAPFGPIDSVAGYDPALPTGPTPNIGSETAPVWPEPGLPPPPVMGGSVEIDNGR